MAKAGSDRNYKFGAKNNWRRTAWNEILRRTNGREQTDPILYLAGPQDLDRSIATAKGVPGQNLIAIDFDESNADRVRSSRAPVLVGDIESVVASWPVNRPVCAVLLDFCAGFTQPSVDIFDLLERKPFREAVILVNMQRGRDAYSNAVRSRIVLNEDDVERFDYMRAVAGWAYPPGTRPSDECPDSHRALQWLVYHSLDFAFTNHPASRIQEWPGYKDGFEDGIWIMAAGNYFKHADPKFYSYKSGVLRFDSVVISNPNRLINAAAEAEGNIDQIDQKVELHHASQRSPEMARKIAAMLAVRTARLAS